MSAKRHSAWVAVLAALAAAPRALATEVVGRVILSGQPVADAVVSLEDLRADSPADAKSYVIDHRDLTFVPHVLVVRAGTSVRFENSDGMPCRIYSISPAGMFVLQPQPGKPVTVACDRPGVIEVRCAEHGRLVAYVLVKENPYYGVTDARGRYEISGVPPGRRTVQAWWEGTVIQTRQVDVRAAKQSLDFRASRPERKTRQDARPELGPATMGTPAAPAALDPTLRASGGGQE